MKRFSLLLICLFASIGLTYAQTVAVSGNVISDEDGLAVIGASIVVKGTTTGTITNFNGDFELQAPAGSKTIVVSYIGMKAIELPVGEGLKIVLQSDSQALDEVVVTAMGISREKKALGYALQEVKSDEITKAGEQNLASSLSGKIAGVQITQQGGQIGASSNIVIRGNSSFGSNQPLIVVDGVPVQNDNGTGATVNLGSGMNDINPEDIESVSVLKGGSAALYGMRAGNGVILITTKSGGKKNGIKLSYNGNFTVDQIYNIPEFQNKYGQGYYASEYDYKAAQADGFSGSYADFAAENGYSYVDGAGGGINDNADESWGPRLDIGLNLPQYNSPLNADGTRQATPWVSHPDNIKNFFDTGLTQNHVISMTSTSEKSSTRASLGFRDQSGTTPNTDQKRYSASLNTKMNFNKYVDFDLSANYIRTKSGNLPGTGYEGTNVLQSLLQWHGRQIDMDDLKANYDQKDAGGNYTHYNWQEAYAVNPYWTLNKNKNKYTRDRFYGKSSLFIKPTEWLKFEGRIGMDHYDSNQLSNVEWSVDYPEGYFRDFSRNSTEVNADFLGYFTKTFGDWNVNALAGANYRDFDYSIKTIGADNLTVPGIYTVANVKGNPYTYENHNLRRSNSVYGNLSLGWKHQAYLDISMRNDWDSTIKDDFFYPSFSGSWILTETFPVLKKSNLLNFLKLRGGWAKIGSATDPYLSNAYYQVEDAPMHGTSLYYNPTTYPATGLRPEMVKTWELGIEATFLDNRINLDLAYYNKMTSDQIMQADVSTATGYNSMIINAGEISNHGLELQLSAKVIKDLAGFNWTTTVNWSKDRSKVEELYTDPETGQELLAYEIGSNWSVKNLAIPGESWGTLVGKGYVYNKDGSILTEDGMPAYQNNQHIGDVTPDWLASWSNEFSYKNWSLGFMLDYRKGGDVYSISQAFGLYTGVYDLTATGDLRENGVVVGQNFFEDKVFKNADGTPNTTAVNAESFFGLFYDNTQMAVFDGSFLKLRELHITYTFPKAILAKTGFISSANISLIGNNLALLWTDSSNLLHIDPESTLGSTNEDIGFESNSYPPSRSFGLKLGVTF